MAGEKYGTIPFDMLNGATILEQKVRGQRSEGTYLGQ